MSARLPEAVSSVQPLPPKRTLDGESPLGPGYTEHEGIPMPAEGPGDVYLLPIPPPPPKRETRWARKPAPVHVATADPRCWSVARHLCPDLERLSIGKDGSVTIHNQPWQAKAARRKGAR